MRESGKADPDVDGGSSCWEGSDLTGRSRGEGLHVPSGGVGVPSKHGGLRKMKPN